MLNGTYFSCTLIFQFFALLWWHTSTALILINFGSCLLIHRHSSRFEKRTGAVLHMHICHRGDKYNSTLQQDGFLFSGSGPIVLIRGCIHSQHGCLLYLLRHLALQVGHLTFHSIGWNTKCVHPGTLGC